MKISELPPKIRQNALKYQAEYEDKCHGVATDSIRGAFRWHDTQEGYLYWLRMYNAEPAKTCYRLFYLGLIVGLLTAISAVVIFNLINK